MKNMLLISILFVLSFSAPVRGNDSIIEKDAELIKVADGYAFTEGPAADAKGNVFFTDQPNDRILKWSTDGKISVFFEGGRCNGLYFDRHGNLLACADNENELWSIHPDGTHTVLIANYKGHKLNGPNDLWIHPKGYLYFTDPLYVRDYWKRTREMQQPGEYVYLYTLKDESILPVATDLKKPNGIIGTPDGKKLYVADIGDRKTYSYDVEKNGTLTNKRLFAEKGSDGMTIDEAGNIYLTGDGVIVYNPQGELIEHIKVPAPWTANVTFGGKDRKTLFITASNAVFTLRMNVAGVK